MTRSGGREGPAASSRRSHVVLVLGAMLLASSLVKTWVNVNNNAGVDFYHFWVVPRAVRSGETTNVYGPEACRTVGALYLDRAQSPEQPSWRLQKAARFFSTLQPTGTPFFYTVMAGWSYADYDHAFFAFQLLSVVAGVAALLWFVRACDGSWETAVVAAVAFTDWFEPWWSDVRMSNVNRLLLGALALFLWIRRLPATERRDWAGGLVLGLVVCFKPILVWCPLVLSCLRLARREYGVLARECAAYAVAAAGAIVGSSLWFGSGRCWWEWMSNVNGILTLDNMTIEKGNYAPAFVLGETFHIGLAAYRVAFAVAVGVPVAVALARRSRGPAPEAAGWRDEALAVGLGVAIYLGTAQLMWLHYELLSVIPLALLATSAGRGWAWFGGVVGAFFCIANDPLIGTFGLKQPVAFAWLVVVGTLVMTALLVAEIARPRAGHSPS